MSRKAGQISSAISSSNQNVYVDDLVQLSTGVYFAHGQDGNWSWGSAETAVHTSQQVSKPWWIGGHDSVIPAIRRLCCLASFLGTASRCCLGPFRHEQKHVQVDVRLKYSEHPSWLEIHFVHTLTVVCAYLLVQSVLHDRSIIQAII